MLADVAQQLDVLEQAHDEVLQIERANGLTDPEVLLRQMAAEPRTPQGAPPTAAAAPVGPPVGRPVGPPVSFRRPPDADATAAAEGTPGELGASVAAPAGSSQTSPPA